MSACRALACHAVEAPDSGELTWVLSRWVSIPFNPPSVGGWPYDEAWLTAAAIPYRMELATSLVQAGNLEPLTSVPKSKMVQAAADWLGVAQWSTRTERALNQADVGPRALGALGTQCSRVLGERMSPCDFNRRQFLKYTGAAGAATMAATLSMDDVAQAAAWRRCRPAHRSS